MANDLRTWRTLVHQKEGLRILSPILFAASYKEDENAPGFFIEPQTLTITYQPKLASSRTAERNAWSLAHEAGHFLCDHGTRRPKLAAKEGRDFQPHLAIYAEEISVNHMIAALSGWSIPPESPASPEHADLTFEAIYYALKQAATPIKVSCSCIHGGDGSDGSKGNAADDLLRAQVIDAASKQVQELQKAGRLPGNLPGELREMVIRMQPLSRPPKWQDMLKRYLIASDFNCQHPDLFSVYKRRQTIDGLCLPNLASSPKARRFVVSMDNSGSVSDGMFAALKGIIHSVAQQLGFQEIIVQHFTTQVMKTERVTDMRAVAAIKRQAAGGTALEDCDARAAGHHGQFHIILTDGYVAWLGRYSLPTIIVRTVKDTETPPKVRNMLGDVVIDVVE